MPSFDVAHIREGDTNIIVVVVGAAFGRKTKPEQERLIDALQICAGRVGWLGTVVPVWEMQEGRMGFVAPQDWHRYFSIVTFEELTKHVNRKLECG